MTMTENVVMEPERTAPGSILQLSYHSTLTEKALLYITDDT